MTKVQASKKTKTTARTTKKPRVLKEKRRVKYQAVVSAQPTASKTTEVKITRAKGRPMLQWVGKKPLVSVTAYPAQLIERFDPTNAATPTEFPRYDDLKDNWQNLLLYGDNKDVLANLLANGFRGKVNLVYIDPPFNTGVDYVRRVTPRGIQTEKIEGEGYSFTEQIQYGANWQVDVFLQFLYERLQLAKEMLAQDGMIIIRMDVHFESHLRLITDEVFGYDLFQNTIVVNRVKKNVTDKGRRTIPHGVDYLLVYFKSLDAQYKNILKTLSETKPGYWHGMESQEVSGPRQVVIEGKTYYPSPGTHFKFTQKQADEMIARGKIRANPTSDRPEYWVEEKDYEHLDSNWTDIPGYTFTTGYPTENSEKLLERVLEVGSKPGDLVMDFFVGSGTTAAVAQKLGRRWIAADINKGAIQTTSKRLQSIILEQSQAAQKIKAQPALIQSDAPSAIRYQPFAVYRVNDYDLKIQHNEAANLAVEHLGITRTRTDNFFDGTRGKQLVKIIPFNHPCTLLDLQLIDDELKKREENRDILVVCLGKETPVDQWVADWNKRRPVTRRDPNGKPVEWLNRIEIVELRTDKKYGGFFQHQPNHADVEIQRKGDKVVVAIRDFISPTIVERLKQDQNLFSAKISDWRAMIDVVLIDTDYDGKVFNIIHSDVPEKKNDLVEGRYELPAPKKGATVAVKIVDMLGEEIVVTKEV